MRRSSRRPHRAGVGGGPGPVAGVRRTVGSRRVGSGRGQVLVVVGASGGAGTTTLVAAVLALAAERGLRVVGVDAHPHGPGLDLVLGIDHLPGLRWPDLADAQGVDAEAVSEALPTAQGAAVLSHDRADGPMPGWPLVVETVQALRECADVIVVDLPRSRAGELEQLGADAAVVVAAAEVIGLAGLAATAPTVARQVGETFVVLRSDDARRAPVAEVEAALDLPVLSVLRADATAVRDVHRGLPPGSHDGPVRQAAAMCASVVLRLPDVPSAPPAERAS